MQKGDAAKLKLLLAGISARLTKNRDFFVQADCTLVSGKKKFDAKLSRADEDYTLHFQGSDRRVDAAEFCAFFAEQAEKYDESVLTYTERSTVVTLSVTARGVQMKQAEREATAEEKAAAANPLLDSGRQYLIRVDQAAALLREIGILTADGKLKNDMIRKYNQIDHYVELVAPMFEQDDSEEIVLLDCACGKSYLSFVMNYYIHEVLHRRCLVIGVDIKEHVIDESRAMAERLDHGIDQRAPARAKEDLRLCLMRQAKIIVDGGPDLIGGARDGGYAGELLARIDRLGNPGDAERLLRHNGYDGPVCGKPVPEGGRPARNGPDNRTETAETPVFG